MNEDQGETIVAPASGAGKAGVCVVRVSGEKSAEIITQLTKSPLPLPRMATLCTLYDHDGAHIDRALVLWF